MLVVAVLLITVTGPDGQRIDLNPGEIVSIRPPRATEEGHFAPDVHCLIHTGDGKFVAVAEPCDKVRAMIEEGEQR